MPPDLPPCAVLDTNSVLDWLVFCEPAALALATAIECGRLRWLASPSMRGEFDAVLPREALRRWQPDAAAAARAWDRHAQMESTDPPRGRLSCRDPDDQVFIDLALHRRCRWLVTRDRALLTLARHARPWGVAILTPERWLVAQEVQAPTS